MPTVVIESFSFRFYSSDRVEPPHMHVIRAGAVAKVWIAPVALASNRGYNQVEAATILRLAEAHRERLLRAWNEYFDAR